MNNKTFRSALSLLAFTALLPAIARAQLTQTLDFTIDQSTGNGVNLVFNKINVSPLEDLYIIFTVTSITATAGDGTLQGNGGSQGASGVALTPSVTFTDVLSLSNATPAPANLTETDNYTGLPVEKNESENILIPASKANSFSPIPNSSESKVIQNLVNFEGPSGTFDLDVNSNLTFANEVNAQPQNFHPVIDGTLTVSVIPPTPEPSAMILVLAGLGLVAGWRSFTRKTIA